MPNWCEGVLKVRGTVENLIKFLQNELVDSFDCPPKIEMTGDGCGFYISEVDSDSQFEIRNSDRHICKSNYIDVDAGRNEKAILLLPMKAAWEVSANLLYDICVKHDVDMKIFAVECGMQFCQDIEIVDGVFIKNDKIKYEDFEWECPFPNMGG